ncbi:uncharacterized protein LW93_6815 [Fusarium fujikuroi]|nr:uncharacterized protein LW93_6815 [Fusarium fujikuroi]
MGNNPSQPTGHYRAGPQYQAPPTHFNRGHTLRETQYFRGGYTLRDPPKKKKMGLVGVPEHTPQSLSPRRSRLSTGRNGLAVAAAQTAYLPPPQHNLQCGYSPGTTPSVSSLGSSRHSRSSRGRNGLAAAAAQTAYSPPPQQQCTSSPQHSRTIGLSSRAVPQHNFSQPARQHFSHGHSLRNNAQLSKKKKNWKW